MSASNTADLKSYDDETGTAEATAESSRETQGKHFKGNTSKLKCLYTNAHSLGNKQEELKATVLLENHDVVAVTETWRDDSHGWNVAIDGLQTVQNGGARKEGRH